jgi:protein-S-isoprenylcysteine O-methyltransferase Ste14
MLKTIIVLPGTVLVFVPSVILLAAQDSAFAAEWVTTSQVWFWIALAAAAVGMTLSIWTTVLFLKVGGGTPAPWDPPKSLVIRGPYRHLRNPMIAGVLLILFSEAMLLQSWPLMVWMMLFFVGNSIYFPLVEEKALEKRFGHEYRHYKAHVPRWIPRLRPWRQASDTRV